MAIKFLTYKNEWEFHRYTCGGKPVEKLDSVKIGGKTYKVKSAKETIPYDDMGHTYTSTSTQFTISIDFHGAKIPVTLDVLIKAKVKIIPVEAKS
jgi:hypothetical protein